MDLNRGALTEQHQLEVRNWEQLFESPGWKVFQFDIKKRYESALKSIENAESMKELGNAQGRRAALREIVEFETSIEASFNELILAREAERGELDESRGAMA